MSYWLRLGIALDAFIQGIANKGQLGVTISGRAETARYHGHRWGCWTCRVLDWIDKDHCHNARLNDMKRAREAYNALKEWR